MKLNEEQNKKLSGYSKIEIDREEFDSLPEYSMSVPTQSGSVGIKKWKHRTPLNASDEEAIWFIGKVEGDMCNFYLAEILGE